jgi:alanine racemase
MTVRIVMACIKGNAYGHGLLPGVRCLETAGSLEEEARAQDRATVEVLVALTGEAVYAYVS